MRGGENVTEYERVFEENNGFIFKYLMKLCGNASLAEELTEETFFRAYINFSSLRDLNRASSWLCSIAKNTYYAWYNENKRFIHPEEAPEATSPDISTSIVERELSKEATLKLRELEEPYKEVFMLSVFGGLTLKEISAVYGKSESWARVTFYRARKKLIERMGLKDEM